MLLCMPLWLRSLDEACMKHTVMLCGADEVEETQTEKKI